MDNLSPQDTGIFNDRNSLGNEPLPNATAVLILGICSIVSCCCYGVPGLLCGIIALVLANKDMALYRVHPQRYKPGSLSNLKGGKICAIIGLILSVLFFIMIIMVIVTVGWATLSNPQALQDWARQMQQR